jgi:hypothetical protein
MKTVLLETLKASENRYLTDLELAPFQQSVTSFAARYNAYLLLRAESKSLVLNTLRKLVVRPRYRDTVKEHGPKCQRDMLYTLECVAKAVLLDDPIGFMEEYVLWMSNITHALHKEASAIDAYRALQEEIKASMPGESAGVVNGYLGRLIEAINTMA